MYWCGIYDCSIIDDALYGDRCLDCQTAAVISSLSGSAREIYVSFTFVIIYTITQESYCCICYALEKCSLQVFDECFGKMTVLFNIKQFLVAIHDITVSN